MPAPSLTYTLSNGTTADASHVMQNFNDLLNGITDGSKDLSISALTCAGNATFNGNVTFGNATSDTITATSRFASSLIPTTASTYDLGSSSLPFKHIFLDNGATDGGRINFDAGSTKYAGSNAAGTDYQIGGFTNFDLGTAAIKRYGRYLEAKSANYVITDSDGVSVVLVTAGSSADITITLPLAANNVGRIITIKKVDSGTKAVIIDGNGSETIDGATQTTIGTYSNATYTGINASMTVQCNGTSWFVLNQSGDIIIWGVKSSSNAPNASYEDAGSLSIPAGLWVLSGILSVNKNAATTLDTAGFGFSTTIGNSGDGLDPSTGNTLFSYFPTTPTAIVIALSGYPVRLTAATTYYTKVYSNYSGGQAVYSSFALAKRVN